SFAATFSAASAGGQREAKGAAAIGDGEASELLSRYQLALFHGKFAEALQIASKFQPENAAGQAAAAGMRAAALIGLKRDSEPKTQMAEAERLGPQIPEPTM